MSYILEALRRADAERERGAVPGLHTRSVSGGAVPTGGRRPFATWGLGVGAGLGVALLAILAWRFAGPGAAAPGVVLAPAVVTASPAPLPATPVATPAPAGTARAPAATALSVPAAAPAPAAERKVASVVVAPAAPKPREVAPVPLPPVAATPAAAVAAPVAPPPRVYTVQELPDDVRAQLPRLTVSGATYSSNPAYRMVIVSGQVLHEGEQAAANTVLEKIEPHAVVLRFRDYRYTVPY
ncbi:MAG: general secretion pathway protein GspB [Pseudomonadota bacterium]